MKKQYKIQNVVVLGLAVSAALAAIYTNTNWLFKFEKHPSLERERCYGVVKSGKNDCANGKHSCENQSLNDNDPHEWIMVPKGVCTKIAGSKNDG